MSKSINNTHYMGIGGTRTSNLQLRRADALIHCATSQTIHVPPHRGHVGIEPTSSVRERLASGPLLQCPTPNKRTLEKRARRDLNSRSSVRQTEMFTTTPQAQRNKQKTKHRIQNATKQTSNSGRKIPTVRLHLLDSGRVRRERKEHINRYSSPPVQKALFSLLSHQVSFVIITRPKIIQITSSDCIPRPSPLLIG